MGLTCTLPMMELNSRQYSCEMITIQILGSNPLVRRIHIQYSKGVMEAYSAAGYMAIALQTGEE